MIKFFILLLLIILSSDVYANTVTSNAVFEIKENDTLNATNSSINIITGNAAIATEGKGLITRFLEWLLRIWED